MPPPKPSTIGKGTCMVNSLEEVAAMLLKGASNDEISATLKLSSDAAKSRVRRVLRAKGCNTRAQYQAIAYEELQETLASTRAAVFRECVGICKARDTGDMTREDMEARRCAEAILKQGERE